MTVANIRGYEGRYSINTNGEVFSRAQGNIRKLKQHPDSSGYPQVVLYLDGNRKTIQTHRLVASAFLGKCPEGYQVDHIDSNKTNNNVTNLRFLSRRDNVAKEKTEKSGLPQGVDSYKTDKGMRYRTRANIEGVVMSKAGFENAEEAAKYYRKLIAI